MPAAIPTTPTEFWAFVVAVIAAFGLNSIRLLKKDMHNRVTREAVQCAVDRCDEMGREIMPMFVAILDYLQAAKIPLFVRSIDQVSFEKGEEVSKINNAIAWMSKLDPAMLQKVLEVMNRLECWSMRFSNDPALADARVAFQPCSTVFCQMVMTLYPAFLTQRRLNPASGPYQNVVTLFKGWYAQKAQGEMLDKLNRLQADKLPSPIGT